MIQTLTMYDLLKQYKSLDEFSLVLNDNNKPILSETIGGFKFSTLRRIAEMKKKYPNSFKVVCAINLILN